MKHYLMSVVAALGLCSGCHTQEKIEVLTPQEFAQAARADADAVVLDVRRADEYSAGHLEGAVNLDYLDTAAFAKGVEGLDRRKTYYVYCRSGRRSHEAATVLQKRGLKAIDMKGGILAWSEAGMALVK